MRAACPLRSPSGVAKDLAPQTQHLGIAAGWMVNWSRSGASLLALRLRIIPTVGVLLADLSVLVVDNKLGSGVLSDLAGAIHSRLLRFGVH